jgi:hypothetical protein
MACRKTEEWGEREEVLSRGLYFAPNSVPNAIFCWNRFHNILLEAGFAAKPDKGAEFEAYNCNAKNTPVVLSVLCAGLHLNIGFILPVTQTTPDSPPKMKVFIDLQSSATVHPSSVNAGALGGQEEVLSRELSFDPNSMPNPRSQESVA